MSDCISMQVVDAFVIDSSSQIFTVLSDPLAP